MKKILFIGDTESIHIAKYVDYFVGKDDYDVCIATFSQRNCTNCNKVYFLSDKPIMSGGGNYHYLFLVKRLADIIKQYRPHYINAHFSYSMGLVALLALKLSNVPSELSVVCHGSDVMAYPNRICKIINKIVLSQASKVIAVSEPMYYRLLEWGIPSKKIFVGQYGVEILPYIKQERNIDVISIRDYSPNSRIDDMLAAISSIKDIEHKNVVFVIPNIKEYELDNLKQKYSYIQFYGRLPHEMIIDFLVRSKVYISATKSDGTALSLLEAMVYGAYPVISDIPTNCCWIQDCVNGRLFTDFDDFKEVVTASLSLPDYLYRKAQKINYALVNCKCNYKKQMMKIEKFLFG